MNTSKTVQSQYSRWMRLATEDPDLIPELEKIAGDEAQIGDRFYRDLEFGTAGLRGIIGAGDNRMNINTVRKATQGLADYLNALYLDEDKAVAISFDSRHKSDFFAREAARVLAGNGIRAHITAELSPTPFLSFAVRELHCQSGIMITASHNPAAYNGYKCYGPDGCQMTDQSSGEVTACVEKIDLFEDIKLADYDDAMVQGMISVISPELMEQFIQCVLTTQIHPGCCNGADLKVVYTPLNGTGNKPVREVLRRVGVSDLTVVPEQENPDGDFPTAPYPNPEIRQVYECALKLAETIKPDLLVATDPDADRTGIAVRNHEGGYTLMTGNEVGCLMMDYILSGRRETGRLPEDPVAVYSIVTSDLAGRIAAHYGVDAKKVLTGFKYIGEQILLLERAGQLDRFVYGFEESYGYMGGHYARDKDAVFGAMIVCEMAAYYKAKGKSLLDVMEDLYKEYGYYINFVVTAEFGGESGMETMKTLMDDLRAHCPKEIAGLKVLELADYETSEHTALEVGVVTEIHLPKSNVLSYELEDHCKFIVRPSGTEPKIKAYVTASGSDKAAAEKKAEMLKKAAETLMGKGK